MYLHLITEKLRNFLSLILFVFFFLHLTFEMHFCKRHKSAKCIPNITVL